MLFLQPPLSPIFCCFCPVPQFCFDFIFTPRINYQYYYLIQSMFQFIHVPFFFFRAIPSFFLILVLLSFFMKQSEFHVLKIYESESCSVLSDSLQPHGLYTSWNSPGHNTRVGSLFLLQGIFPTQRSNLGIPHCRRILNQLSHNGSPRRPYKAI